MEKGLAPAATILIIVGSAVSVQAQQASPLERVEALGLDTAHVGRVTAHFAPADRERAMELATLSDGAARFFDRELGISFDLGVAALPPEHWFEPIRGIPYAVPWASISERLLFVPSSLDEGILVQGRSSMVERRRVIDFITLHEYGHVATKEYFHPASELDDLPVSWFNELLPNVFAYAFMASTYPEWTVAAREMWLSVVTSWEPAVLSLDWGFMNELPPDELVRTYGWYQNLLNLRAAELVDEHGLDFLRMVKDRMAWAEAEAWTTESLLTALEQIAPGFHAWVADLENGDYVQRMDGTEAGAPPTPALDVDRELAGIEETRNAFMAALKAGRPQDLGGLVTPDMRSVGPGAPEWDHMRSLADDRGSPFPYDSIVMRPIETVVVNDSIAWDFGTSSVYYTNEQGAVRQLQDTYLVILKKGDGGVWRLHREVASARVE